MINFNKDSIVTIYTQLANALRTQILSGELQPGDRIEPEIEIAERNGISRSTVRQAMNLLVNEGLLERLPGKGTFVRALHVRQINGGTIGLVVPYARDTLIMDILLGVETGAKSRKYSVMFSFNGENLQQEASDLRRLRDEGAQGVIVFPISNVIHDETIWQLYAEKFPMVLIDRYFPELPTDYVVVDNAGGAYQAAQHLIHLGYQSIGFLTATRLQTTSAHDRFLGFRKALADHGIQYCDQCLLDISRANGDHSTEVQLLREALRNPQRARAYVALNDFAALRLMEAARLENLNIPQDVAVVGFDDIAAAAQVNVPLTTISQPRYDVGFRAVQILLDRLEGNSFHTNRIILPTTLVVRESCGARQSLSL